MFQLPSFARAQLTISHRIPSSLILCDTHISTLMGSQMHAPIENAANPRPVYPAHPSAALTSSIDARRNHLVAPVAKDAAPRTITNTTGPRIGLFAAEVKR